MKKITKSQLQSYDHDALKDEVKLLSECKHPNIIRYIDFFDEPEYCYLLSEVVSKKKIVLLEVLLTLCVLTWHSKALVARTSSYFPISIFKTFVIYLCVAMSRIWLYFLPVTWDDLDMHADF